MPKVSIIIPVYNAQEYLGRCLDSVCKQTLKDIEIICVNDCSSDNSGQILQKYAENYPNLIVINLEKNQGESNARNKGLFLAKGEYLSFVDNDDEIDLNFCEKLYEKAAEDKADIAKGQAVETSYNGRKHVINQIRETDSKFLFATYWWSAIYKRSLIIENKISFPVEYPLGGDILFLNRAIIAAKNLSLVEGVFYHYYRRKDSGDGEILSQEKIESVLSIHKMIIDNINLESELKSDPTYNLIFHHFIIGCFYLSLKTPDQELKNLCAKTASNIFEKCHNKEALESSFAKTVPHLFMFLKNKDVAAVAEVLIKCKSRSQLIASGLRARIKQQLS
jgi:glycosyltransferase involved in cell wall biosynthesis